MEPKERSSHKRVTEQLIAGIQQVDEMPDGYSLRLPSDPESNLNAGEFIRRELACCPFFAFELTVGSEEGPTWLRITGGEGVKNFLSGLPLVRSPGARESR